MASVSPCAVIETMKVETREWKRVTQQSNVLLRKAKRQSKQITSMNDEIKRLKAENDELCIKNKELNKELEYEADTSFIELNEENELLKLELKALKDANVMFMKRYEKKVEEEKKIIFCFFSFNFLY